MAEHSGVQSVERTFLLLEILCKNGETSVTELSSISGLHKTTVCRLLSTLCNLGYVKQNEKTGRYGISLKFLTVSSGILNTFDIRTHARPSFKKLSKESHETVHLVCRDGDDIVYIDKFESPDNSVRMVSRIGFSLPMICTAVGKAILATMDDRTIEKIWNRSCHEKKTPHTIMSFDKFIDEINLVRKNGFAVDNEENELGVRCVAAALPDPDSVCRYAFSVSAPITRMDDLRLGQISELVLKTKNEIIGKDNN